MHVLIAIDGSASANAALRFAAQVLLRSMEVHEITLLTVVHDSQTHVYDLDVELFPQATWDDMRLAELEEAQHMFDFATAMLGSFAGRVSVSVRAGRRVQQIVQAARDTSADMLVLGATGSGVWDRLRALLFGSVVGHVLEQSPCPVIVVPTDYAADSTRTSYIGTGDWSAAA
jgi:nucleotide-binding universal stress UspA family protein